MKKAVLRVLVLVRGEGNERERERGGERELVSKD